MKHLPVKVFPIQPLSSAVDRSDEVRSVDPAHIQDQLRLKFEEQLWRMFIYGPKED